MSKWKSRKKKAKGGGESKGKENSPSKKVGGTQQKCPKHHACLIVIVKYRHSLKYVQGAHVTIAGPTSGAKKTGRVGHASWSPVKAGDYTIKVVLPREIASDYELVPERKCTVPENFSWNETFYIVPKPRLKVRVIARRLMRPKTQNKADQWVELRDVKVNAVELGSNQLTSGAAGWADFGIVKPGDYTVKLSSWGTHQGKYTLVQGEDNQVHSVPQGTIKEVTLHAVRDGWIEWQVTLDKPKTGEKAEVQGATLTAKLPGNFTESPITDASGVARIDELDPGNCDVDGMTYDKEPLEIVTD